LTARDATTNALTARDGARDHQPNRALGQPEKRDDERFDRARFDDVDFDGARPARCDDERFDRARRRPPTINQISRSVSERNATTNALIARDATT
jgi:hypothetical protein